MKILYVLYAYDHEWGGLQEGAMGDLTWKGKYSWISQRPLDPPGAMLPA